MIEEDLINPEEWTSKELLKHVFREVREIKNEVKSLKEYDIRVSALGNISDEMSVKIENIERRISNVEIDLNGLRIKDDSDKYNFRIYLDIGFKIIGTIIGLTGIVWGIMTYLVK